MTAYLWFSYSALIEWLNLGAKKDLHESMASWEESKRKAKFPCVASGVCANKTNLEWVKWEVPKDWKIGMPPQLPHNFMIAKIKKTTVFTIFFALISISMKKYVKMNVWLWKLLQEMHQLGIWILELWRNWYQSSISLGIIIALLIVSQFLDTADLLVK
jgi:hypothetical protein